MKPLLSLLVLLVLPPSPALSQDITGTWMAVAPEEEAPVAAVKIEIKADGSLRMEQEISDDQGSFTYVITGTWVTAGDTISIHMSEAEARIGTQTLKDQTFSPSTFNGSYHLTDSTLSLSLQDENGTEFVIELQRSLTSISPINWAQLKKKIRAL